ncbi:hypothetical protein BFJ66_g18382 [Fusarium oxysporum f. sp. cepae]|uniref:Uncharacterized protein n=1 Tax=Fusarium oxysporum f. sp. cepae TaxID=396571 RepID=A0A3L6MRT4_FUSOX|nr:hypothetical protein BFJ65_g18451 [Fusarium oxysporum f. sp. cepae]RKK10353.1 hypothetical protein BFJ67_g18193 [Fusarium oxysporum f. sp. cepae]RKK10356.1 hypothetical protein BFJ66_g18382 [Fusarium oxysporum f. sp. cepae]
MKFATLLVVAVSMATSGVTGATISYCVLCADEVNRDSCAECAVANGCSSNVCDSFPS